VAAGSRRFSRPPSNSIASLLYKNKKGRGEEQGDASAAKEETSPAMIEKTISG
jgi:hypothetical protein